MSINGPSQTTSNATPETSKRGFLAHLRTASLIAVIAGSAGSVGLMFHAGWHTPRLLLALFVIWVLSPFVVLIRAHVMSKHWSALTRATLYIVMLVVTLGSLAIYADDARAHRRPQAAFVYVIVPPASWLLIAIAIPIAAFMSRKLSRQDDDA